MAKGGSRSAARGWLSLGVVVMLALAVRLWRLDTPRSFVWDEVHFWSFAAQYARGAYFIDVHAPLGKLLYAAVGWSVEGWPDGVMSLPGDLPQIGSAFPAEAPWLSMRGLSCLAGVACVFFGHKTLSRLGCHSAACTLGGCFLALDNALVVQSRLVLLDMVLLAFLACAVHLLVLWRTGGPTVGNSTLLALGVCLGAAASTKYVAIFVILAVGTSVTAEDLMPAARQSTRLAGRLLVRLTLGLIVIPVAIYVAMFAVHLHLLPDSGPSDRWMRGDFQATLRGSRFHRVAGAIDKLPYGASAHIHAAVHSPDCSLTCDSGRVVCVEVPAPTVGARTTPSWTLRAPTDTASPDPRLHHGSVLFLQQGGGGAGQPAVQAFISQDGDLACGEVAPPNWQGWRIETIRQMSSAVFDLVDEHGDAFIHNVDTVFRLLGNRPGSPMSSSVQLHLDTPHRVVTQPEQRPRLRYMVDLSPEADLDVLFHFVASASNSCPVPVCGVGKARTLPFLQKFWAVHVAMMRLNSDFKVTLSPTRKRALSLAPCTHTFTHSHTQLFNMFRLSRFAAAARIPLRDMWLYRGGRNARAAALDN